MVDRGVKVGVLIAVCWQHSPAFGVLAPAVSVNYLACDSFSSDSSKFKLVCSRPVVCNPNISQQCPDSLFLSLQQRIDFFFTYEIPGVTEFECLYATSRSEHCYVAYALGSARNAPHRTVVVGADMIIGLLGIVYQEKAY